MAILARLASRWGFSAIPLYLLAGLAFGNGGLMPLNVSQEFVHVGAEIGVVLLIVYFLVTYYAASYSSGYGLPDLGDTVTIIDGYGEYVVQVETIG